MFEVKASFSFAPDLEARQDKASGKSQQFVDSEVLRLSAPYMPQRTGTMIRSGILGTIVGSGLVVYDVPYADEQYHETADRRWYDPLRGAHWFERMKADHGKQIIRGAKTIYVATGGLK